MTLKEIIEKGQQQPLLQQHKELKEVLQILLKDQVENLIM